MPEFSLRRSAFPQEIFPGEEKENKPFPHFVGIANSYDIPARDVFSADELEDAIREMLETPGPFLLDCHTVYQDHVLPMIPGGKSCKDMITE